MNRNKRIVWIIFIAFAVSTCFLMIRGIFLDRKMKKEGKITTAKIIDYKLGYRGGISFIYSFNTDGEKIVGKKSFMELVSNRPADFLNKSFPVIYLKDNPSYNYLLLSRYSFNKFGILFPDSLKWVIKFEK